MEVWFRRLPERGRLAFAGGPFFCELGHVRRVSVSRPEVDGGRRLSICVSAFHDPPPPRGRRWLETASKLASAEMAALLFSIAGTPVLRDGNVFQLPGIIIEVAQECSGIRSSWVLFITSLMASYLFLKTPWRRAVLVSLVIPLAILRNGLRILTIGVLCVQFGPQMINSVIHHRGGPLFFALSLIPLFLVLWWLRKEEKTEGRGRSQRSKVSK